MCLLYLPLVFPPHLEVVLPYLIHLLSNFGVLSFEEMFANVLQVYKRWFIEVKVEESRVRVEHTIVLVEVEVAGPLDELGC